jgi:histidinol-phosphate aminotransferase
MVYEAFVEHGDSVIYPNPTFAMYQVYAQMFGAQESIVEYQYSDTGPVLNVEQLKNLLRLEKPKIFCLPNPDSPTGTVLSQNDLKDLLTICEEVGAVFLLDEAYYPFYEWSGVNWTQHSRNLIIARTFAKAWGAAGMRIGYLVAHPDTISLINKLRPMYELGTVSIDFMVRMLDHVGVMQSSVEKINVGKIYFATEMSALDFKVLVTEGNFVHVAFGEKDSLIAKALANKVLYRQSFNHPSLKGFSRFSIAPKEKMEYVVELIKQALDY